MACRRLAPTRLVPFSYFWICWNVIPRFSPSFSWLIPSIFRAKPDAASDMNIDRIRLFLVFFSIIFSSPFVRLFSIVFYPTERLIQAPHRTAYQFGTLRAVPLWISNMSRCQFARSRCFKRIAAGQRHQKQQDRASVEAAEDGRTRLDHRLSALPAASMTPAACSSRVRRRSGRAASIYARDAGVGGADHGSPVSTARICAWRKCW